MIKKLIYIVFFLIAFQACKPPVEIEVDSGFVLTKDSLSFYIQEQFEMETTLLCQDELEYVDTLKSHYSKSNFTSLWWDVLSRDSASWEDMRSTFAHSIYHGMDSTYYNVGLIDYYSKQIPNLSTSDSAYRWLAEMEIILSNSMLAMYEDIGNGRTDPKEVYGYTYMLPRNNVKELEYFQFLESSNKINTLDNIHYGDTSYNESLKLMSLYLLKKTKAQQDKIDFSEYPKLEVGDTADVIPLVIKKLQAKNIPNEKIHKLTSDTLIYTKALKSIILELQEMYQLTPDGIMGYKTYQIINAGPQEKINQIKANLERQRWYTKPTEKPFAYINLPEYDIEMHWEDSVKTMRVCIGKNLPDNYDAMVKHYTDSGWLYKLPKNMETPQIASNISYLVINPTWTVPYSIIKREMWWKLVKDPTHLSAKGFKVYRGKTEINGDTINWSKVNRNKIPYRIVEDPGPKNSLGTVKYMFYNPFSIYLHDTPSKSAFKRTQRAVSHGCVRLENPILFGEFLMQNSDKYDADDFRIMMGYEPKDEERLEDYDPADTAAIIQKFEETTKLRLDKLMPLYLDYRTVYFDEEWRPRFCYDIYDQNKLIIREMYK